MNRKAVIDFIFKISKEKNAFEVLEDSIMQIDTAKVPALIMECGVLPELFAHDSSEEKLWAKYSDNLLARAFTFLGLQSKVNQRRSGSADVLAKTKNYKMVGDAKTFRLSRTAKNQKDFKVEALDKWRRKSNNNYAVLVCPQNQFPSDNSAIYEQAIEKNVTLLSYAHLYFLMSNKPELRWSLKPLWNIGHSLRKNDNLQSAKNYWKAVDTLVVKLCHKTASDLAKVKKRDQAIARKLGTQGIAYWEDKIKEYSSLSKEEAVRLLLKSEKIEAKIEQIKKAIGKDGAE